MQMTVTWTSGYSIDEAVPFVEWGLKGEETRTRSPAGTLTVEQNSMCGMLNIFHIPTIALYYTILLMNSNLLFDRTILDPFNILVLDKAFSGEKSLWLFTFFSWNSKLSTSNHQSSSMYTVSCPILLTIEFVKWLLMVEDTTNPRIYP